MRIIFQEGRFSITFSLFADFGLKSIPEAVTEIAHEGTQTGNGEGGAGRNDPEALAVTLSVIMNMALRASAPEVSQTVFVKYLVIDSALKVPTGN